MQGPDLRSMAEGSPLVDSPTDVAPNVPTKIRLEKPLLVSSSRHWSDPPGDCSPKRCHALLRFSDVKIRKNRENSSIFLNNYVVSEVRRRFQQGVSDGKRSRQYLIPPTYLAFSGGRSIRTLIAAAESAGCGHPQNKFENNIIRNIDSPVPGRAAS